MTTTLHNKSIDSIVIYDYKNNQTHELQFETFTKQIQISTIEISARYEKDYIIEKYTKLLRTEIATEIAKFVTIESNAVSRDTLELRASIRVIPSYDHTRELKIYQRQVSEYKSAIYGFEHMSVRDSFKRLIRSILKRY